MASSDTKPGAWLGVLGVMVVMGVAGSHVSASAGTAGASSGHSGGAIAALESLASSIHVGGSSTGSGAARAAIHWAEAQQGCPYVWAGTGPCSSGFDCSGLVMQAYAAAGVNIPRTSQAQWAAGTKVPMSQLKPGDLVFYAGADGTVTSPGHVVMYVGGGQIVEAYASGTPVHIVALGSMPGEQNAVGAIDPTAGA